jgi:hypothetical protein
VVGGKTPLPDNDKSTDDIAGSCGHSGTAVDDIRFDPVGAMPVMWNDAEWLGSSRQGHS